MHNESQQPPQNLVILMQGIQGSGKTTWARLKAEAFKQTTGITPEIVSADAFFEQIGGFIPARLQEAHNYSLRVYIEALQDEVPLVIVDNTNTTMGEAGPYGTIARAYGYRVNLVRTVCPLQIAVDRCIHHVPRFKVEQAASRIEKFVPPREWRFETVSTH